MDINTILGGSESITESESYPLSGQQAKTESTGSTRTMYATAYGMPTASQIQRAISEFQRKVQAGDENAQVTVASGVPLFPFLRYLDTEDPEGIYDMRFDADVADESTICDVVLIKLPGPAHEAAVIEVSGQLREYSNRKRQLIVPMAGRLILPGCVRKPDRGLEPAGPIEGENPIMPRLLIEIEVHHRTLPAAHAFCLQYFELISELRSVILLKFFSRRSDGSFAALAVRYRREENGIGVRDAVSFGPAPLSNEVNQFLANTMRRPARVLPAINMAQLALGTPSPWQANDKSFVRVPRADLFQGIDVPEALRTVIRGDLHLFLFPILQMTARKQW